MGIGSEVHEDSSVSDVKLTFEEFTMVLTQVEAVLNSRPLVPMPRDDDGIEPLTPGHILIGKHLESLPDPPTSYHPISLLRCWHLCQLLIRHFWKRWSTEYLSTLRRYTKWHYSTRNFQIGDLVILRDDNLVPLKWPMGRITGVYPGRDGMI